MRDIILDLVHGCPGKLADAKEPHVIGCAMGEVLFQAGVPVDLLLVHETTQSLFDARPQLRQDLMDWLGVAHLDDSEFDSIVSHIEVKYDLIASAGRTEEYSGSQFSLPAGAVVNEATLAILKAQHDDERQFKIDRVKELHDAARILDHHARRLNINFILSDTPQQLHFCPLRSVAKREACEAVA